MYWDGLNTYNLCAQIDDEAVDLVQARFGLNPGVTLQTSPGYLPLSVFNITAVAEEPAQFWFTEVPVDADPERIETPDDLIVPSAFTKDGPEYTFVAALVDMRNPIDEGSCFSWSTALPRFRPDHCGGDSPARLHSHPVT